MMTMQADPRRSDAMRDDSTMRH